MFYPTLNLKHETENSMSNSRQNANIAFSSPPFDHTISQFDVPEHLEHGLTSSKAYVVTQTQEGERKVTNDQKHFSSQEHGRKHKGQL